MENFVLDEAAAIEKPTADNNQAGEDATGNNQKDEDYNDKVNDAGNEFEMVTRFHDTVTVCIPCEFRQPKRDPHP